MKAGWELRTQDIRLQGDEYRSWESAVQALMRRVNSHVIELQRAKHPQADDVGRSETLLHAEIRRARGQTPRTPISILLPPKGSDHTLAQHVRYYVGRFPW